MGWVLKRGLLLGVPWSPSPDRMKFDAQWFSMVLNSNLVVAKLLNCTVREQTNFWVILGQKQYFLITSEYTGTIYQSFTAVQEPFPSV